MMKTMKSIHEKMKEAYSLIKKAQNVLVVTHYHPDGDALSSICVMMEFLTLQNKKYMAFCHDAPPLQYNFLPQVGKIVSDRVKLKLEEYDLLITLDCGDLGRTKLEADVNSRQHQMKIVEIDHHPRVFEYSDVEIRNSAASSTVEVLYEFFVCNQVKINKTMASCILTGILTDTGNLLYQSTSDETVKIASKMMSLGARYPIILENTFRNKSISAMKIWGLAMSGLTINKKYNFALTVLTKKDIDESGANEEELEGVSGFLSSMEGVKGLLLLRESENGLIRGSLRTADSSIDVSKIARILGGGGHSKASGFVFRGEILREGERWAVK